jgi:hypothetical protein
MSYQYSKGAQVIGDLKAADDTERNTQIDFGEDYIGFETSGSLRMKISGSDGSITFNEAFTFPISDGSANQILKTNGSGQLSWTNQSGGGGGISFDGSTVNGVLTYKDSDEATVESNFTFDAGTQTAMISGSLHLRGEERIIPAEFQTSAKRERSFTMTRHIQISTTTTNSWLDIISWQPKVTGTSSNPSDNQFWGAVSFEINLSGHYNGVANAHRRVEGVVFYNGSSASSANTYNNSAVTDGAGSPSFRVNRSGWISTLQFNLDHGSAQGFEGMAYVVIHFTRGAGAQGDNIFWDIT